MKKNFEEMSIDELKAERQNLQESIEDAEQMHSFTFDKSSVHISATKVGEMQDEFEEEVREYREKIAEIDKLLKERGES